MWILDRMLRRFLHRGELTIVDHDGSVHRVGAPAAGIEPVSIRLTDARVAREIVRSVQLGTAEAYMDGRLLFERGDILALIRLVSANRRWEDAPPPPEWRRRLGAIRGYFAARNHEARARRNVAHHYDIGNRLYALFLDEDWQYSCGYFTDPANGLDQAQADKKAHIAAKLFLQPGQKVLDIGCGWGGMALYLHRHYDVDVLGVTLSEAQLQVARERAAAAGVADRVRFEMLDYRNVTGQFDRIVSVGMFEHVGAAHYDAFFRRCAELLVPQGVMLLHTIGRFDHPKSGDPFADKYIFPGYHLPNLSQIIQASERSRLIASDVETLRLHYALTLGHWLDRTRAHRADIVEMYDERFFRMWEVYLAAALAMFETGAGCVFQVQYVRHRGALPITRDYMEAEERRLRAGAQAMPPIELALSEPEPAADMPGRTDLRSVPAEIQTPQ
ncbi:cyclopropane-fatty-acyl-phospholipid synthase family protein [Sphingosinicella sp. CPCC 101087]|uniref:SAM-dependent methyltransferase n=1 Tax=Sphingosinicella sp. CPCC 101087 TaxID=2497754 RepID=UPI00101DFD65|nr:cyclopropane-fatty-acyl-phospholipid synthase family protein [Sphingosinicella sp. CPCC 101087]